MVHSKDDRGLGWRLLEGAGSCLCYASHTHFSLSFLSIAKSNPSSIHAWGADLHMGSEGSPRLMASVFLTCHEARQQRPRVGLGYREVESHKVTTWPQSCAGKGDGWPPPGFSIAINKIIMKDSWVPTPLGTHPSNECLTNSVELLGWGDYEFL